MLSADLPARSPVLSFLACLGNTVLFVVLLYVVDARRVWRATRRPAASSASNIPQPVAPYSRDDPRVIKRRFFAVALSSAIVPVVCQALLGVDGRTFMKFAGLRFDGLLPAAVLPLLLTATIFAGPLALLAADGELFGQRGWKAARQDLAYAFGDLRGLRNYVVGPLAEEWVFRSCMAPLLVSGNFSETFVIFVAPLLFGLAHIHHALIYYQSGSSNRQLLRRVLCQASVQFVYTTVFGWYASALFLRTGHYIAPALSHLFCNAMGLPDFATVDRHPKHRRVLVAAFIVGIVAFGALLIPLVDPTIYRSVYYK